MGFAACGILLYWTDKYIIGETGRHLSDAGRANRMQDNISTMPTSASHMNIVTSITLEGTVVRFVPMSREHVDAFWNVAKDAVEEIFRWIPYAMKSLADFQKMVEKILTEQDRGESVAFTTTEKDSGQIIGSTRFMNIDRANRRAEIGSTWIAPSWQRTAANTEAKYLMLRHAFEVWNCIRVELKTDALNQKSRNAILRLGAKQEGILRRHIITSTGRIRDTVYFSILDSEWPEVKERLESKLSRA
jgi:N-acetyltransferase